MPARLVLPPARPVAVKICGLTTPEAVDAAVASGAAFCGFVFFPPSPRALAPATAAALAARVPTGRVGLFVDPDDALLDAVLAAVPLDLLQLHGAETPARIAEVRARFGLPVMKAVGLAAEADLPALDTPADLLLVDAKPAPGAALPGGNGIAFDWRLLAGRRLPRPWLLAGGLCYTLGTVFYLQKRMPYAHAIWHGFVVAGTVCHFIAVWALVVPAA